MAHENIFERRAKVLAELQESKEISHRRRKELAEQFACSVAAIRADIVYFLNINNKLTIHISSGMRKRIRDRDGKTCQYCQKQPPSGIVEHVIPFVHQGVAREYNLVFACQSCNVVKSSNIWLPFNLLEITATNDRWRQQIFRLANIDHQISKIGGSAWLRRMIDHHAAHVILPATSPFESD